MTAPRIGEQRLERAGAEERARRLHARFRRASKHWDTGRKVAVAAGWLRTFIVWAAGLLVFGLVLLWIADVIA